MIRQETVQPLQSTQYFLYETYVFKILHLIYRRMNHQEVAFLYHCLDDMYVLYVYPRKG